MILKFKPKPKSKDNKGFTLVELIIVVALIGILTAIAIPVYGAIQETSKKDAVEAAAENGYKTFLAEASAGGSTQDRIIKLAQDLNPPGSDILVHLSANPNDANNICVVGMWTGDEDQPSKYPTPIGKCGGKFYS